jgi:hypothetical protein
LHASASKPPSLTLARGRVHKNWSAYDTTGPAIVRDKSFFRAKLLSFFRSS